MASREEIYEALFNLTANINGIKTRDRSLKLYSDLPSNGYPALFQNQSGERYNPRTNIHTERLLKVDWYLYLKNGQSKSIAQSTQINNIMSEIDKALAPSPITMTNDLSGLVAHCWIEGEIKTVEGFLNDYSIVIIPIYIKTIGDI